MYGSSRRLSLAGLALGAALVSTHCQRADEAPGAAAQAGCCDITPNTALPAGRGSIVVRYPGDGGADSTRLEVFAASDTSKAIDGEYGDAALELTPGIYDVTVGGRRVAGVRVQAGHDTRIRVGVLHMRAGQQTHVELLDQASGATFADGYGERLFGVPIGTIDVEVAGRRETALIEDGRVFELRPGRLVVAYPEEVSARIEVVGAGETQILADGYGNRAFDLFPGTYDVTISGKRVSGATVRSGADTPIEVGVLRVHASDGTYVELADPISKQRIADGYGTVAFGLPVGEVGVRIAGQMETVLIEAGQVTEF